jgi:hypothetical protein
MWLNGTSSAGFLTAAPLNSGRSRCDRVSIDWLSDINDLPGNHNDPHYGGVEMVHEARAVCDARGRCFTLSSRPR